MTVLRDFTTLPDLFGLQDRTALVTGASTGLGAQFAKALAVAGADVAVTARRGDRLETVAAELRGLGVRSLAVAHDLLAEDAPEHIFSAVEQQLGPVDILVNNAGLVPLGKAETLSAEKWRQAMAVNLEAVFRMSQRAARAMLARGNGGRIINLGTAAAHQASPFFKMSSYIAAKGGVVALTRQLAMEWAPGGITVNCISPGYFPTEINIDPRYGDMHPDYKGRIVERTPMGRLGEPVEIVGALVFLASPSASFVTGVVLPVDGGWLA